MVLVGFNWLSSLYRKATKTNSKKLKPNRGVISHLEFEIQVVWCSRDRIHHITWEISVCYWSSIVFRR